MRHLKKYNEDISISDNVGSISIGDILNDNDIEWIFDKKNFIENLDRQKIHDGKEYTKKLLSIKMLSSKIGYCRIFNTVFIFKNGDCLSAINVNGLGRTIFIVKDVVVLVGSIVTITYDTSELTYKVHIDDTY